MGDARDNEAYEEELLDYEEEDEKVPDSGSKVNGEAVKKGYVGIHSSGFRDFLLKPELLRAIVDSGFEHPSEETMSSENEDSSAVRRRVSCTKCFDALWFCYSPFYQMQQYYRVGKLDDCTKKFSDLFDCLSLKTKRASEAEKILEEREKADAEKHIWVMRTQEEASSHWNEIFGHLDDPNY